jgi:membrane associated rhomboid family serine protease
MNPIKLIAALLIIGGVLGLAYGGFSYTQDKTVAKVGPISINAEERHTINVPMWAGIGGILVGGLLLAFGGRKD